MCWHDAHVHALRFEGGEQGEGALVLDIDYILGWHCEKPQFSFRVAPATLRFHGISNLRVTLDYATPTAGMCPFSLAGITREAHVYPNGFQSFRWLLTVNWPDGEISFQSPGFTQDLAGPEVTTTSQWLSPAERSGAGV